MSMRLEAQDEKAYAELTLGRRRTKGAGRNRARTRKAFRLDEMDPPPNAEQMRPHIFGERLA